MSTVPPPRHFGFDEIPIIDEVRMDEFQPLPSHLVTSEPDSVTNGGQMDVDGFPIQTAPVFRGSCMTYMDARDTAWSVAFLQLS